MKLEFRNSTWFRLLVRSNLVPTRVRAFLFPHPTTNPASIRCGPTPATHEWLEFAGAGGRRAGRVHVRHAEGREMLAPEAGVGGALRGAGRARAAGGRQPSSRPGGHVGPLGCGLDPPLSPWAARGGAGGRGGAERDAVCAAAAAETIVRIVARGRRRSRTVKILL